MCQGCDRTGEVQVRWECRRSDETRAALNIASVCGTGTKSIS